MIPFRKGLESLHLPFGQYALFGSTVLAVRGLRDAKDLDIAVKKELWDDLIKKYPENFHDSPPSLQFENIDIFRDWKSLTGEIDEMIDTAEIFEGIPVVRPEYLFRLKKDLGREKDFVDIELLTQYLSGDNN
ncbi:MAG: hypothetical protein ACK4NC_01690 [Candidatus Gracilibacteria bacterium]